MINRLGNSSIYKVTINVYNNECELILFANIFFFTE